MDNFYLSNFGKTLGITLLALNTNFSLAQDVVRLKTSYDFESDKSVSTIGIGPRNVVGNDGINTQTRFFEYFRFRRDNDSGDYIFNLALPEIDFLDSNHSAILKLENEGYGIDTKHHKGNFSLRLNGDRVKSDFKNQDIARLGLDLVYDFGDVSLGVAFDSFGPKNNKNKQYLLRVQSDLDENNQIGLVGVKRDDLDSIGAYYIHYGEKEKWGTRTRFKFDSHKDGSENLNFESIWVQNPDPFMLGKYAGAWILGRNAGDMYDVSPVNNLLGGNGVNLYERSRGGFAGLLSGDIDEGKSKNLDLELGYTLPLDIRESKFGFGGVYSQREGEKDKCGLSLYYGKGPVRLEGKLFNNGGNIQLEYSF
ncbi:MAG: hypothetical protein KC589_11210 [Nanoarchaeota archaeon]|nr:hypothetical protein [Nanoarchaeota archaeon]